MKNFLRISNWSSIWSENVFQPISDSTFLKCFYCEKMQIFVFYSSSIMSPTLFLIIFKKICKAGLPFREIALQNVGKNCLTNYFTERVQRFVDANSAKVLKTPALVITFKWFTSEKRAIFKFIRLEYRIIISNFRETK